MTHKIIIDTDLGVDDAMAIAYAIAHPEIELLALTTIFGNVSTQQATQNGLRLLEYWASNADVAEGEHRPLLIPINESCYEIHGPNGFGEVDIPTSQRTKNPLDAVDYIVEACKVYPKEIVLCAIGPLTNLARLLERDPNVVSRIKIVVVMGGAVYRKGNVTPMAEANLWNDPHAAHRVLSAPWPLIVAPLDSTMPLVFSTDYLRALAKKSPALGEPLAAMAEYYIRFYRANRGVDGCVPHDVVPLFALTTPAAFRSLQGSFAVLTAGDAIGQLLFQPFEQQRQALHFDRWPDHRLLIDTNPEILLKEYMEVLSRYRS